MKRLTILIGALVMAMSVYAAPPIVEVNTNVLSMPAIEWRYVGVTTHTDDGSFTFDGKIGRAAMNAACIADYGPGAHAANLREASFRDDNGPAAWVAHGGPMIAAQNGFGDFGPRDAVAGHLVGVAKTSESSALNAAYCFQFTFSSSSSSSGPTVNSSGQFVLFTCDRSEAVPIPVACAAPFAIPTQ